MAVSMIWIMLLLVAAGLWLSHRLQHRPGVHRRQALIGLGLALLALISGFSIGLLVAAVAAVLLILAAQGLSSNDRVATRDS
jgi:hypothetical protein